MELRDLGDGWKTKNKEKKVMGQVPNRLICRVILYSWFFRKIPDHIVDQSSLYSLSEYLFYSQNLPGLDDKLCQGVLSLSLSLLRTMKSLWEVVTWSNLHSDRIILGTMFKINWIWRIYASRCIWSQ